MADSFAIARLSKMAGIEATFTFNPAALTPRIRNAAKKMILAQAPVGGWKSEAKKVAKLMLVHHHIPYTSCGRRWLELGAGLPVDVREQLRAVRQADQAAFILEFQGRQIHKYYLDLYEDDMKLLDSADAGHLAFNEDAFSRQAFELLCREFKRSNYTDRVHEVAAMLDTDNPIQISAAYGSIV